MMDRSYFARNEVKKIRLQLGLSVPQFAKLLDVACCTAYAWEKQVKNPCLSNCYKIIELCGRRGIKISVQDLIPPR